jgi:hypothetical protein
MATETTIDMTQDTTPSGTTLCESRCTGGFKVPIGDSGETFESVWHFGG